MKRYIPIIIATILSSVGWFITYKLFKVKTDDVIEIVRCKDCVYRNTTNCLASMVNSGKITKVVDRCYCCLGRKH